MFPQKNLFFKLWEKMPPQLKPLKLLLFFLFWTLIGLSFAGQFYISSSKAGLNVSWKQAVAWALGDWYPFALLSIPVLWLAGKFRLEAGRWQANAAFHFLLSLLFSVAYMVIRAWVGQLQSGWFGQAITFREAFQPLLYKTWHFNILIYWVIVAVASAVENYRRLRQRELQAAELERNLVQAQLHALQMQLNPHFLFNTLHAISSLMHSDVEAADKMLIRLSDLLRHTLESMKTPEVTLSEEVSFLTRYLEIEKTRFGPRLEVETRISGDVMNAMVPNLILQPILENAIRHGIEKQAGSGKVTLTAERKEGQLVLQVHDTGKATADKPKDGREGIGLKNTKTRLETLYPGTHQIQLLTNQPGTLVQIEIPYRE